jgi:non-ribosomal peptide synthetase component F
MHHIIFDGTSMKVFIDEFTAYYTDPEKVLPPLAVQYKDFAAWRHGRKGVEIIKKQEEYWLKRFSGKIPKMELTGGKPRTDRQEGSADSCGFRLEKEVTNLLVTLAREEGTTLFMVLLAMYNILLNKLSWNEDIIVGAPVQGRPYEELQPVVGMFVNTLPLRNMVNGEKTFGEFLEEITRLTLEAFENQLYPLEALTRKIAGNSGDEAMDAGLFDTVFLLQNLDLPPVKMPGVTLKPYGYKHLAAKFDLVFVGMEDGDAVEFEIEYRTSVFEETSIRRYADYFQEIALSVSQDKQIKIQDIEISNGFTESEETIEDEASGDFGF